MVTKATRDVIDLASRPVLNVDIRGGNINATTIGATTPADGYFANLHMTGTAFGLNAFYADVAERYRSDEHYAPGTIVKIGGTEEITASEWCDEDVFGVISTNPAFLLNNDPHLEGIMLPVALIGRVPCRVVGPMKKGQRIISAGLGIGCALDVPFARNLAFARYLGENDNRSEERLVEVTLIRG